jgi:hypothetical protein
MKPLLKKMVGWEQRNEPEKAAFFQRFEFLRYRLVYLVSFLLCFFPIPLAFLLRVCLSDKQQPFEHDYGHTYGALFRRFKYRPIKLLEIGIGGYGKRLGGESLNAWQAYFPFATIVGCDIRDKSRLTTPRTNIYLLDQSSKVQLEELCKKEAPFDIIIDDGSHLSAHQIGTFEILYLALKPGGLYIVEDIQTSYWSHGGYDGASIKDAKFGGTCVGYFLKLAKYINHQEFMDFSGVDADMLELAKSIRQIIFEHNLIIVLKGDSSI